VLVLLRSWVILKNSDVVSADLAAAAVCAGQRLGSSTIPSWYGFYTYINNKRAAFGVN
jgi:hypothetical protein